MLIFVIIVDIVVLMFILLCFSGNAVFEMNNCMPHGLRNSPPPPPTGRYPAVLGLEPRTSHMRGGCSNLGHRCSEKFGDEERACKIDHGILFRSFSPSLHRGPETSEQLPRCLAPLQCLFNCALPRLCSRRRDPACACFPPVVHLLCRKDK